MAQVFGLGTVGWSPLGGGLLTGKYSRGEAGRATSFGRLIHTESDARKTATADALLVVAEEAGVSPTVAALAWMGTRGVFPILGPRTVEQLQDDLAAADYDLSADHVARLMPQAQSPWGSRTISWPSQDSLPACRAVCPAASRFRRPLVT